MESAKRQFVELYGSALVMNTYLKIALVLVSLVALGLLALNFHTAATILTGEAARRADRRGRPGRGRAYDASRYQPQPPELRYFLTQFVVKHFSRIRATLQREYPDSLFFLNPALADATIAQNEQSRVLEMFVTNPSADEIEVSVQNVSLSELGDAALQGGRDLPEGLLHAWDAVTKGTARPTSRRSTSSCATTCRTSSSVSIRWASRSTYFRVDQAFEEGRR